MRLDIKSQYRLLYVGYYDKRKDIRMNRKKILILLNTAILSFTISTSVINFQKVEAKEPEVRIVEKEKMEDEIFKNKDYIGLVKSIGHAERLSEDKDAYIIYTKDSMNRLKSELEKARKVVKEKEKLTKKLVEDTRDSLELAIVELVKRNNVKPIVRSTAKPKADKEVVSVDKPLVNSEAVSIVKPSTNEGVVSSVKPAVSEAVAEVVEPTVSMGNITVVNEEIKPVSTVIKPIENEILKNKDYIGLIKSIGYAENLSEDKDAYMIYTKDSMNRLKNELQKARKVVNEKEKLTKKLVEDTRDSLELAIVELVKIKNLKPAVNKEIKPVDKAVVKPVDKAVVKPVDKAEVKPVVKAADKTEAKQKVKAEVKNIQELPKTGDFSSLPYVGGMVMSLVALMKLDRKNKKK